ncbi:Pseudouridine-5'-phosphate glycosidase 2 [Halotydeus destructor]|nr:Pseudouridine-5'-phosphate glycosidase 2 [Halotydeus destructor]
MAVENIVRENGAIPATIALVDGQLKVGLELSELEKLSQPSKGRAKLKLSRRDLAFAAATGASGGTTVAATMAVADKVGIRVFATGGCGGVHRGAESSMDISADLVELSRTNVALVCSGIKSILDIGRTLEYLETMGVPVITLDEQCDSEHLEHVQFPAFFTRSSGLRSPMALNCIREAARVVRVHNGLDLKHGLMIAVPIPATEAATGHLVAEAIEQALLEAKEKGVSGKNVTPFILQRVNDLTQGHSLKSNCGLVRNNARVAAQIACDLYNVQNGNCTLNSSKNVPRAREKQTEQTSQAKPVVIGGSIIDYVIRTESSHLKVSSGLSFLFDTRDA